VRGEKIVVEHLGDDRFSGSSTPSRAMNFRGFFICSKYSSGVSSQKCSCQGSSRMISETAEKSTRFVGIFALQPI